MEPDKSRQRIHKKRRCRHADQAGKLRRSCPRDRGQGDAYQRRPGPPTLVSVHSPTCRAWLPFRLAAGREGRHRSGGGGTASEWRWVESPTPPPTTCSIILKRLYV